MSTDVSIKTTLRGSLPRLPYDKMAAKILPRGYELSLVVCGDELAQRMNKEYRKKTYRPNVLSFPISKSEGEIFLNVRKAAREARRYQVTLHDHLAHLFVHGCFHLKGLKHGRIMESHEERVLRIFGISCRECIQE